MNDMFVPPPVGTLVCVLCFKGEHDADLGEHCGRQPAFSNAGHLMRGNVCLCVDCHRPFLGPYRCESNYCRGKRAGFAEAMKLDVDVLFPPPVYSCPNTESHGYPCEKNAGHAPPCACPKALARFMAHHTNVVSEANS